MKPELPPILEQLRELVVRAARQEILPRFNACTSYVKADNSIVTAADYAVQNYLQKELLKHWPEYDLLGEEMPECQQAECLSSARPGFWCLDPLDGTNNFAAGIPFFAISLALVMNGEPVLGIIYDPLREECFMAAKGQGAWMNEQRLSCSAPDRTLNQCIAAIDFKRLDAALAGKLAQQAPYRSQRNFGSVALEWSWLAAGRVHLYLHGGQKLWDYAAGSLILAEAGGSSMTLQGQAVFDSQAKARSVVAALNSDLFQGWTRWLGVRLR